jgi:hypothetical protein
MVSNSWKYLNSNVFRIIVNNADNFSTVWETTTIIFCAVVHNAEKLLVLLALMEKSKHELKLEYFSTL